MSEVTEYDIIDGKLVNKNKRETMDEIMTKEQFNILDSMTEKEKSAFIIGMSYTSARLTVANAQWDKPSPHDLKEVSAVVEALDILGIETPLNKE